MIGIIIVFQFVQREHSSVRQKISATYLVSAVTELPTVRMKQMRLTAVSEKLILCQHMPQKLHCLVWIDAIENKCKFSYVLQRVRRTSFPVKMAAVSHSPLPVTKKWIVWTNQMKELFVVNY